MDEPNAQVSKKLTVFKFKYSEIRRATRWQLALVNRPTRTGAVSN